jgi:sugar transferase (PEP-CTERM/EpsH1 system associated)
MRLLFLTPRLPYPPNRGGEIIIFNVLRTLSQRHELALVSFYDSPDELDHRPELARFCRHIELVPRASKFDPRVVAEWVFLNHSYSEARHRSRAFAEAIRRVLAVFPAQVVQLETFLLGQYLPQLTDIPTVLHMHDVTWLMWDRLVRVTAPPLKYPIAIEARRIRRDESAVCRAVDVCATVSSVDRAALTAALDPPPRVVVVTPGVDTDRMPQITPPPAGSGILFVGSMHYAPNVDAVEYFCRDILPRIAAERPDVTFTIVGAKPSPAVVRLAQNPRVTVTGLVDDVRPYYASSAVTVIPLRVAGGVRLKILEGLALGSPMISTSIGAEGLGLTDGVELLIADTPESFAAAVVRLLDDGELRRTLSEQARQAAERRFSWNAVAATLTDLYESLAAQGRQQAAIGAGRMER